MSVDALALSSVGRCTCIALEDADGSILGRAENEMPERAWKRGIEQWGREGSGWKWLSIKDRKRACTHTSTHMHPHANKVPVNRYPTPLPHWFHTCVMLRWRPPGVEAAASSSAPLPLACVAAAASSRLAARRFLATANTAMAAMAATLTPATMPPMRAALEPLDSSTVSEPPLLPPVPSVCRGRDQFYGRINGVEG